MGIKRILSLFLAEHNIYIRKTIPRPSVVFAKGFFKGKKVNVVEIGTYEGRNAVSILKELNVNRMVLIDPYKLYDSDNQLAQDKLDWAYRKMRRRVDLYGKNADRVKLIMKTSERALRKVKDGSLDFVYVDGDHRYSEVKKDVEGWWNKLKIGGILAGHDIDWEGVMKGVGEFSLKNNLKVEMRWPDWWIVKKEDNVRAEDGK